MSSWQEIIQNYHIKHHNQIAKTTAPLRSHFHVTCIDYLKISNSGTFSYLSTHPECAEYYASENLFYSDPYFRHPSTHKTGLFTMESVGSNAFKDNNCKVSNKFNLHSPLILSKNKQDSIEIFCFSGDNLDALQMLYLHHPSLLKLFAAHFKNQLSRLLKQMDEASFSLIALQGDAFYQGIEPANRIDRKAFHSCLIEMGKQKEVKQASFLTPRERDCLRLLIHGNSAKDTALELHLSHRTIEFYLENIKNKLCCSSKRELFSIGSDFADLGLL